VKIDHLSPEVAIFPSLTFCIMEMVYKVDDSLPIFFIGYLFSYRIYFSCKIRNPFIIIIVDFSLLQHHGPEEDLAKLVGKNFRCR